MGYSRWKEPMRCPGRGVQELMGSQDMRFRRKAEAREIDMNMNHTSAPALGFLLESQLPPTSHPDPVSPLSDVRNLCVSWSPQKVQGLAKSCPQVFF